MFLNEKGKGAILISFATWCSEYYCLIEIEDVLHLIINHSEEQVLESLRNSNTWTPGQEFIPVSYTDFLLPIEFDNITEENLFATKLCIDQYIYEQKRYINYLFLTVFGCNPF